MKLITFLYNSKELVGVITPDGQRVVPCSELGVNYADMETLAAHITDEELAAMKQKLKGFSDGISLSEVKVLAPVPRPSRDIICLGVNFLDHALESADVMGGEYSGERKYPIYFAKHVNEAVPNGDFINGHFDIVTELDYEAEMAFIVRKDAVNVKAENAGEYVFGYTVMNDVSARCIQMRHKQWFRGKSFDGFAPMGPCVVTADEFEFPPKLDISCKVNGELRQKSNTALYIHNIPYALEELSSGMLIKAGTIISMGTPGGVGMGFKPPKYLKSGDVIECEVQGIGKLVNTVK